MEMFRRLALITFVSGLTLVSTAGCPRARSQNRVAYVQPPTSQPAEKQTPASQPATTPNAPAQAPAALGGETPEQALRAALTIAVGDPRLLGAKLSVLVQSLATTATAPLYALAPDAARVPASNAKLLTTTAAATALRRYRFVTEVSHRRGGPIYIWSTGDPLLKGKDIAKLALMAKRRGVRSVRGVVVDDSYFDKRRLAPGFTSFSEGAYYRPTSSALNVDGNAVTIRISAPRGRRRPRVDVYPPSDYVKVHKRLRFYKKRRRRRGQPRRPARKAKVEIAMRRRGSIMWLDIKGIVPRGMRPISTRRAVYDPALNVGWALRRALKKAGVKVKGVVRRGRRPKRAPVLARHGRRLTAILKATNLHSDNLAAETLVRAMGKLGQSGRAKKTWELGLARLTKELKAIGVEDFWLGNGSGLHRRSRVTAKMMVTLLQAIYRDPRRKRMLLPTLSIAGRAGTLARRMRGTAAEGSVKGKTGTLGGVLALSGFVFAQPAEDRVQTVRAPLAFSILVNGKSNRRARAAIDRIAELLALYVNGKSLALPSSLPTSLPTSQPSSAPAITSP